MKQVPSLPISSLSSRPSVEQMVKDFEKSKVLPPQSERTRILQYLTNQRILSSNQQRYLDAAKYLRLYKDIRLAYINEKTQETKRKQTTRDPEGNLTDIKRKIAKCNQMYKEKKQSYILGRDAAIRQAKEQHWDEIKQFRAYWNDPVSLVSFAKPSYQLQQLRVRERKQALICDYEGAEETKRIADKLEKEETRLAQEKARQSMNIQYEQMLQRQEREIQGIELHYKRKLDTLEKSYNEKIQPLNLGLRWQSIERDELIRKTNQVSTYTNAKVLYPPEEEPSIENAALTPRTFAEITEMRNRPKSDLLRLRGIDIMDEYEIP